MKPAALCCIAAAFSGLVISLPARAGEWRTWSPPGQSDVIAAYTHDDGAALLVVCGTDKQTLSISYQEPQANWQKGQGIDVITLPDTGLQLSPSYGVIVAPTQVVVNNDASFDLWTMRQAKGSFKMSVGDFSRIFPAANFRSAIEPVLKACGIHE